MAVDPTLYNALVNRQYANVVRFRYISGNYFGYNFTLDPTPSDWVTELGEYHGKFFDRKVDFYGYWIFKANTDLCWQAVNARDSLTYWNLPGNARVPEDWELFTVQALDPSAGTVTIIQSNSQNPVRLVGTTFTCNVPNPTSVNTNPPPAVFVPEFETSVKLVHRWVKPPAPASAPPRRFNDGGRGGGM